MLKVTDYNSKVLSCEFSWWVLFKFCKVWCSATCLVKWYL